MVSLVFACFIHALSLGATAALASLALGTSTNILAASPCRDSSIVGYVYIDGPCSTLQGLLITDMVLLLAAVAVVLVRALVDVRLRVREKKRIKHQVLLEYGVKIRLMEGSMHGSQIALSADAAAKCTPLAPAQHLAPREENMTNSGLDMRLEAGSQHAETRDQDEYFDSSISTASPSSSYAARSTR